MTNNSFQNDVSRELGELSTKLDTLIAGNTSFLERVGDLEKRTNRLEKAFSWAVGLATAAGGMGAWALDRVIVLKDITK